MPQLRRDPEKGIRQKRPGGSFYLSFTPEKKSKQRHICLHTTDKRVAIEKAIEYRKRPALIGVGTWHSDMLAFFHYRVVEKGNLRNTSADSSRYLIKQFMAYCDQETVRTVSKAHAAGFFRQLRQDGRTSSTRNTYLARLTAFWQFLYAFNKTDIKIFEDIELEPILPHQLARDEWLETSEIKKLISNCKDNNLKFVMFMGFGCGLRKKEIIYSHPGWFDFENERLVIEHSEVRLDEDTGKYYLFNTKNRRNKSIPLPRSFITFLQTDFKFRENQKWCLEKKGKGFGRKYRYDFRSPLEKFFKENGIVNRYGKPQSTHFMRHSFASNCVRAGKATLEIASWLGNRERTVENHYAHVRSQKGALDGIV
jgi:integrase